MILCHIVINLFLKKFKVELTINQIFHFEYRNTQQIFDHRNELLRKLGSFQVPCLKIEEDIGARLMYESRDIIDYLERCFA